MHNPSMHERVLRFLPQGKEGIEVGCIIHSLVGQYHLTTDVHSLKYILYNPSSNL